MKPAAAAAQDIARLTPILSEEEKINMVYSHCSKIFKQLTPYPDIANSPRLTRINNLMLEMYPHEQEELISKHRDLVRDALEERVELIFKNPKSTMDHFTLAASVFTYKTKFKPHDLGSVLKSKNISKSNMSKSIDDHIDDEYFQLHSNDKDANNQIPKDKISENQPQEKKSDRILSLSDNGARYLRRLIEQCSNDD